MTDVLVLASVALVSVVAAFVLRPGPALIVSVVLGVVQIYLTTHVSVSIGAVWQLAMWIVVVRNRAVLPRARTLIAAYVALIGASVVVLLWSTDRSMGLTVTAQMLGLGAVAALAVIVARRSPRALQGAAAALAALVVVFAVSTITFRWLPAVEHAYFVSPLFGLLNGNDLAAHFFTTERNNVLDVAKSGGLFFVNANAASLFAGASAALLSAAAVRLAPGPRLALAVVVVLDLGAALATGSKTAVYLAAAALLGAGVGVALIWRRSPAGRRARLLGALTAAVGVAVVALPMLLSAAHSAPPAARAVPATASVAAATPAVAPSAAAPQVTPTVGPDLATQSADAIGTRQRIWRIALAIALRRPWGTFGYGGWHDLYAPQAQRVGLDPGFPPHDWVIETWSEIGPVGLVLVGVILVGLATVALRGVRSADRPSALTVLLASLGAAWVLVHGLADNTGFDGGPRLIPIVALIVAVVAAASTHALPGKSGPPHMSASPRAGRHSSAVEPTQPPAERPVPANPSGARGAH